MLRQLHPTRGRDSDAAVGVATVITEGYRSHHFVQDRH